MDKGDRVRVLSDLDRAIAPGRTGPVQSAPEALPPNPKQAYGAQKPDLSLIPVSGLHHTALAFEEGGRKYGPYNWRDKAVEARTYVAAAQRHIADWLDGTERSGDADVHNLGHAVACLLILMDAQEIGNLIDNRPLPGKSSEVLDRLKAWKVEQARKRAEGTPPPPPPAPTPLAVRDSLGAPISVGDQVRVSDHTHWAYGQIRIVEDLDPGDSGAEVRARGPEGVNWFDRTRLVRA